MHVRLNSLFPIQEDIRSFYFFYINKRATVQLSARARVCERVEKRGSCSVFWWNGRGHTQSALFVERCIIYGFISKWDGCWKSLTYDFGKCVWRTHSNFSRQPSHKIAILSCSWVKLLIIRAKKLLLQKFLKIKSFTSLNKKLCRASSSCLFSHCCLGVKVNYINQVFDATPRKSPICTGQNLCARAAMALSHNGS